jgi:hypothetical protein
VHRADREQRVVLGLQLAAGERGEHDRRARLDVAAAVGPVEGRHAGERLGADARAGQSAVRDHPLVDLRAARAEVRRRELERLQQPAQLDLGGRERGRGRVGERRAGGGGLREQQRAGDGARRPGAGDGIVEPLVGGEQVLGGGRPVRQHLGPAQRQQHRRAALLRRRLGERTAPVGDRAVGGPAPHRGLPGRVEQVDRPGVAAGRRMEQLGGDLLDAGALVAQHARGPLVLQRALGGRQLVVDGVADQRVDEAERRLLAQDLRLDERAGDGGDRALVAAGEGGHGGQRGALPEHGDGACDRAGVLRQPPQPYEHRRRRGARADGADDVDVLRGGRDALGLERAQELAQQQRVAAGGVVAGGAEQRVRGGAEPVAHEHGDGVRAQWAGADRQGRRVLRQLGDQAGVGARLGGAERGGEQDRQALQPPREVREEAQRRAVAPVQVVDGQQQRPLGGDVRGEPVEPVQRRERRDALAHLGEHRAGGRRRTGERRAGPRRDVALEQLAHDAERELALQLRRAGGEDAQRGPLAQAGQQAGLADPGGALDQDEPAAARRRRLRRGVQRGLLGVALEQHHAAASAPARSRRERTPSLRYALERWTSTVLGVTNSAWAMSRLVSPVTARSTTRRSDAVSAATPACASVRGRAPVA